MTATLLREAADRLERALTLQIGAMFVWKCDGCYGRSTKAHQSTIQHTPDCLITRLRVEAEKMEKGG